jgi:hypothetical protein
LTKGQIIVNAMMVIAVAVTVFGSLAAATVWSPGTYGLERGSFSLPSQQVGSNQEVVQLGGTSSQASSQEQTAATVQLGSSSQLSTQVPVSGAVQLSGYFENMGSYTNIFYPSIMLGGTFGSSGGSGCGCCG